MQEEQNSELQIELANESATESLGRLLASSLARPMVICLSGDLGAGKTTLTRGFLRAMGHLGAVKSPTFTLVESYAFESDFSDGAARREASSASGLLNNGVDSSGTSDFQPAGLHHFDLYRIEDPEELDFIGFEEYLDDDYHTIIEWPARAGDRVSEIDFDVRLVHVEHYRKAYLRGRSPAAITWLENHINLLNFNKL